jgi:hypothetical protein
MGIRNATVLCTALALAFFPHSLPADAAGRVVTISLAPPRAVMCDSVRVDMVKVVVAAAARLGNPCVHDTSTVKVTHGSETFAAPLAIH